MEPETQQETNTPAEPKQKQNIKKYLKIFGYGFLLFIVTNILLFIMSIATGAEETEHPPAKYLWVGVILALLITVCSWWLARRLHPATTKQAFIYGVIFAVMNIVFMLCITIPNGTTGTIFGQWSTYLIYIGIAVGPLFMKKIPANPDSPTSQ